jgi:ATP-dependent Clp protease protease subunit
MGNWNFPDDVVPNKFKDELNDLGDVSTINVRINSGGGSVFAAYAIMNLLKAHKARIIVHIDGIAASAATLIAMAGDKIISALGSVFMVHLPSTWAWGNSNEIQKTIDALTRLSPKTKTNAIKPAFQKSLGNYLLNYSCTV